MDKTKKPSMKLYKSEEGLNKIMSWYENVKSEINVEHESIFVTTRFGKTHAIVAGEDHSKSLILIPGIAGCAPLWRHQINELSKYFKVYALDIVGQPGKSDPNPPSVFNDDLFFFISKKNLSLVGRCHNRFET